MILHPLALSLTLSANPVTWGGKREGERKRERVRETKGGKERKGEREKGGVSEKWAERKVEREG